MDPVASGRRESHIEGDADGDGQVSKESKAEGGVKETSQAPGVDLAPLLKDENNEAQKLLEKDSLLLQPQLDKYTDTSSTHKLYALKVASVNFRIESAKKLFSDTFNKTELDFFEKLFRIANITQDGFLNDSELMFFLDQHDYIISKQEARQIVKEADANKDGSLEFAEFLALCKRAGLNLKEIGIEDGEAQLQNSQKIRDIFRRIFDCIGLVPSIQETIAEHGKVNGNPSSTNMRRPAWTRSIPRRLLRDLGTQYDDEARLLESDSHASLFFATQFTSEESITTDSEFDYDLIVIGSGAGGNGVAKEAAKLGKKVAICESPSSTAPIKSLHWRYGASCLNVGCVPKMMMNYAGILGDICSDKRTLLPFGWFAPNEKQELEMGQQSSSGERGIFTNDWTTLVDNIQSHIRNLNYERLFTHQYYKGIQYYNANCEFDGPHKIMLTHEDKSIEYISGEKIVIAVGSVYKNLDIPGAVGNCITVDDIFSSRQHPGRVLIVGGGADAIECAGLLCGLNIEVTIMSRSPALRGFDRRMVTLILETLHNRGVKILFGWSPTEIVSRTFSTSEVDGDESTNSSGGGARKTLTVIAKHVQTGEKSSKDFDTIVLAIGKKPTTPFLKLEKAEVLLDENTLKIWVDSQDMTTIQDLFALGDCALNRPSGTPLAYLAGVSLSKRLYHGVTEAMEYDQVMPTFLLTPVQYSCVGLSEEAAVAEHGETSVEVYHSRFQPLQYQLGNRHKDVYYAKMITLKTESDRVIGLHYLGPNAGEVIQGFVLALKYKATKADFDAMIPIHPTCAEIFSRMTKTTDSSPDSRMANSGC